MKELSEVVIPQMTRRQLLINYFSIRPVPSFGPGDAITVEFNEGMLFGLSGKKRTVSFTYEEVMHVLGEMRLKGLPFRTAEDARREEQRQYDATVAALLAREQMERNRHLWTIDDLKYDDDKARDAANASAGTFLAGALPKFFKKT